jgi:dTDP-4-dehydrorhamnose 3,5-epimerase
MKFEETTLQGAYIVDLQPFHDERGFFARAYCANEFEALGMVSDVVQANLSTNNVKGTLRGMHYQLDPYQETKFVRCTRGSLYDVIIDLRPASPTYMAWIGVELTADNHRGLFVPRDFAHGFVTLEDHTEAFYMVSQFYTPGAESGIRWNDPAFHIEWPIEPTVISQKDAGWQDYQEISPSTPNVLD